MRGVSVLATPEQRALEPDGNPEAAASGCRIPRLLRPPWEGNRPRPVRTPRSRGCGVASAGLTLVFVTVMGAFTLPKARVTGDGCHGCYLSWQPGAKQGMMLGLWMNGFPQRRFPTFFPAALGSLTRPGPRWGFCPPPAQVQRCAPVPSPLLAPQRFQPHLLGITARPPPPSSWEL